MARGSEVKDNRIAQVGDDDSKRQSKKSSESNDDGGIARRIMEILSPNILKYTSIIAMNLILRHSSDKCPRGRVSDIIDS